MALSGRQSLHAGPWPEHGRLGKRQGGTLQMDEEHYGC